MSAFDAILAVGAGTVLLLGVVSGHIRNRAWISEPAICLAVGTALSPLEFELLGVAPASPEYLTLVQQVARVTLAISVMGAALRLPESYVVRHWRELAVILGIGLPLMCLSGTVLAYQMLSVPLFTALLIGSVVAPTDPVLADSIVAGKTAEDNVPGGLRDSITAESGANDGLALLLVMIPILLMSKSPAGAAAHWLAVTLLWQVLAAIAIGAVLGWLAGQALFWAYAQPFSERISKLTVSVVLALTCVACVHLIGSSGILASFVAGLAFLARVEDPRHEHVQEAIGRFFDLPVFILFGLSVPWRDWLALDWTAWLFVGAAGPGLPEGDAGRRQAIRRDLPRTLGTGVRGTRARTLTSYPSIQDDIRNAGGNWVDREVVQDGNWVTSRKPDDLPAFKEAMIALFARG